MPSEKIPAYKEYIIQLSTRPSLYVYCAYWWGYELAKDRHYVFADTFWGIKYQIRKQIRQRRRIQRAEDRWSQK